MMNKQADLAGPGISTYEEVAKILPRNYDSILTPKETMKALFGVRHYIEENLCKELNLMMVQVPLIVDRISGVNDMLDRDGSRTPVEFPCGLGLEKRMDAQVVQAATKWKRMALKTFGLDVGEGLCTDMWPFARITSSIMTTAPMWISGTGKRRSVRISATLIF